MLARTVQRQLAGGFGFGELVLRAQHGGEIAQAAHGIRIVDAFGCRPHLDRFAQMTLRIVELAVRELRHCDVVERHRDRRVPRSV